jgi:hypothetical protein
VEFDMRGCFVGLDMKRFSHHAILEWLDERDIIIEICKLLHGPGGKLFAKDVSILSPNPKRNEGSGRAQNRTA